MSRQRWWEELPWDYASKARDFLKPGVRVLDLSPEEGAYPFGREPAEAVRWNGTGPLPFADGSFDLVLCRFGLLPLEEAARVLAAGGFVVAEQVGGSDSWEPGPLDFNLENQLPRVEAAGFRVMWRQQAYPLGPGGRRGHRFIFIAKKRAV